MSCADQESFVRGGPTLTTLFFSLMRGGRIKIPLLAGHHRPVSETPSKWLFACVPMKALHYCWLGSFVIFKGIRTSIAKKPFIFCDFPSGSAPPPPPPLWIRECMCFNYQNFINWLYNVTMKTLNKTFLKR